MHDETATNEDHAPVPGILPLDPDVEHSTPPARTTHLRWSMVGLVAFGGFVGTALRAFLSTVWHPDAGVSWAVFWINVVGAFLLGVLLEVLALRGSDQGRRRALRLLLGTGVLGGFTTYSTLAESTAALLLAGRTTAGVGYGLLTVVVGAAATAAGLLAAAWAQPGRGRA